MQVTCPCCNKTSNEVAWPALCFVMAKMLRITTQANDDIKTGPVLDVPAVDCCLKSITDARQEVDASTAEEDYWAKNEPKAGNTN